MGRIGGNGLGLRRWGRTAAGALLLAGALLPPLAGGVGAAPIGRTPVDLAAMALTPADLADLGLEGYGADSGEYIVRAQMAATFAANEGIPVEEAEAIYDELGLVASYFVRLAVPGTPVDAGSEATEGLVVSVHEYESADLAADGLAYEAEFRLDDGREEVEMDEPVGDGAHLFAFEGTDPGMDLPVAELDLAFHAGRFLATVDRFDFALDDEAGAELPDADEVVALGDALLGRIEGAVAPGLSTRSVRLTTDEAVVFANDDRYLAVDGTPIPRFGETPERTDERAAGFAEHGIASLYSVEQAVTSAGDPARDDPRYVGRVYAFADEATAETFLEERALDFFATNDPSLGEVVPVDDLPALGDGAVGAAFEGEFTDGAAYAGHAVFVRVGSVVARVQVLSTDGIGLETALELAEAQVACLEDGACLVAVPAGMLSE
jgi:hypothetical protein